MSTVFPVEFEILAGQADKSSTRLFQGFTRDVSEHGMCIELKSFGRETEKKLTSSGVFLDLTINPAFSNAPIKAQAKIVWLKKEDKAHPPKYWIGVSYESIDPASRKRLIRHARRMRWLPTFASMIGLALLLTLTALWLHNQSLISENTRLVNEVRASANKKSEVAESLVALNEKRRSLESALLKETEENKRLAKALGDLHEQNSRLHAETSALSEDFMNQKTSYENELKLSQAREAQIREQLVEIQRGQKKIRKSYQTLQEAVRKTEAEAFHQMSDWLLSHQHKRTGLVASFEGDPGLEDTAFTYDQAVACQAFLLFDDTENAKAVLEFFDKHAKRKNGAFFNAYETLGGSPQEQVVHTGPNVWIGIAALQYEQKIRDGRYLAMAQRLGDWAIRMQDEEGGLRGGPDASWYSTEHNLDAYAFFGMLYQTMGEEKYAQAQAGVLSWLKKYAYSVRENRINRGKGDATIATDTFGWAIAAVGPAKLKEIEFDPEGIMDFVEKNCRVSIVFKQPSGQTVRVKGFDFSKVQNLGRGGVISCEWTAQLVVSYQMLSKYFESIGEKEKSGVFREKADFYLSELQKLIIASSSRTGQGRGCLPYASAENVDTGHGWRTPKGSSTGSVAATVYGLFAWRGYNPFEFPESDYNKRTASNPA